MPSSPTYELCSCKKCSKDKWKDPSGRIFQGSLQLAATRRKHMIADQFSEGRGRSKSTERELGEDQEIEDAVLLSTITSPPSLRGEFVPSRLNSRRRSRSPEASTSRAKRPRMGASSSTVTSEENQEIEEGSTTEVDEYLENHAFLLRLGETLEIKKRRFSAVESLQFQPTPETLPENSPELDTSHQETQQLSIFLQWLESSLENVRSIDHLSPPDLFEQKRTLEEALLAEISRIESAKLSCWGREKERRRLNSGEACSSQVSVDTTEFFITPQAQPWVLAALIVVVALHTLSSVSRSQCSLILNLIRVLIHGVLASPEAQAVFLSPLHSATSYIGSTAGYQTLLRSIPLDVRTATQRLGLEPDYRVFACCPTCFATHEPTGKGYPRTCDHRDTPGDEPCGEDLLKPGGEGMRSWVPKKPYPVHSLRAWLGRLLSRTGIEDLLEKSWDLPPGCEHLWKDIMHAPGIRQFKGPKGTLFSAQPDGTYHLVFSLFVDWFNPFGNKAAGKSHSIGAIYMVCLNLPPELRYRTENMFLVGIIPGPREPRKEQLNHLLRPLIDELLLFWLQGVHFSKTAKRSGGCDVFAAVIPLVCDLPAARKTAGFSGHSASNICSFCDLQKSQLNNLDRSTWKRKTWVEHLRVAREWRDAPNRKVRERIFAEHGIRWSELLRLPYWDPTRYTVVDAMHNLYLGELAHHCREVLGIEDGEELSEKQKEALHSPDQQKEQLLKVVEALRTGSKTSLMKVRKGYVQAFAALNDVATSRDIKEDYVSELLKWYQTKDRSVQLKIPPSLSWPTADFRLLADAEDISDHNFIDKSLRSAIRADLKKITFPSWMNRPPHNFGSKSHGNLKADQWRTAATICMPITLIQKWGSRNASPGEYGMLENLMHLVTAVEAATTKTMSYEQAGFFDHHMYAYLTSLRSLFDHDLVPNHHMALHLRECLELFGPVHAWWTFPFERYNGILAKLNANNKPAEMPTTFLRYFCMGANLRSLMSSVSWPENEYYRAFKDTFNEVIGDALRGLPGIFAQSEAQFSFEDEKMRHLPRDVYDALLLKLNSNASRPYTSAYTLSMTDRDILGTRAQSVTKVSNSGIDFFARGDNDRGGKSSYIICKDDSATAEDGYRYPAQIEKIFYHARQESGIRRTEAFFVVRRYSALSKEHAAFDLFRLWTGHPTKTWYNRFEEGLAIVRTDEIVSHFSGYVYTPQEIGQECILVYSLER